MSQRRRQAVGIGLLVGVGIVVAGGSMLAAEPDDPPAPAVDGPCLPIVARTSGQKAFPTAEGFGRFARGGRGGAVHTVTTLAAAGPGSLRACAEASGPRTCVFAVSGTIELDDWIKVEQPYLTIAGQTSPGGIAIKVRGSPNSPLLIQTHDVVVRHLRLRPGPSPRPSDNVDTVQISGGAHDVILDHVSTSWPTDEGINIVGDGHRQRPCADTSNVTVQWSILSEGLDRSNRGPHSRGTYFGYGARQVSFHHNLIASNVRRNPLINTRDQFDMVNNVIYNSGRYNGEFYTRFGNLGVNVIGNVAIVGPSSRKDTQLYLVDYFRDFPAEFQIYLKDNLDLHRRENRGDERLVLEPHDWRYVRAAPVGPLSLPAAAITGPAQAYRDVLAQAGATMPGRDAADRRLLGDMAMCRGAIISDPAQVGGWPVLTGPTAPADGDGDGDGIADAWELRHGLSPSDPTDGNRDAGDGYTYLEKYLDELAGSSVVGKAAGPDPDVTCGFAIADVGPLPDVHVAAAPDSIEPGQTSRLEWHGDNIRSCKLAGAGVPGSGSMSVKPRATTTYEIACTGANGGDTIDSVVVTVAKAPISP